MADKISIAYIGPKPKKKDTVTGSRLVFIRNKPMDVEESIATRLLDFPKVWVLGEDVKAAIKAQKEKEAKKQKEAEELLKAQKQEQADANMMVIINGETLDISKYTSKQLVTVIEAEELEVETAKSPIEPYRLAIRNALREKNGTPEVKTESEGDQE